ncbi:MAG TPA: T9SS type A sorting domain-containing protein [Bacteroidia bacterium]|nr:T9SS type A sorting domain-containing protein [Bacteroidia bacterium]
MMRFYLLLGFVVFYNSILKSQSTFDLSGYSPSLTWTANSYAYTNTQNGTTLTLKISHSSNPGWFNLTGPAGVSGTSPNWKTYTPGSCGNITGLYLATNRSSTSPTVTADMSFSPSVCGPVTFTISDLNGADNSFRDDIRITAYDQTGGQIALTTAMVSKNGATSCTGGFIGAAYLTTTSGSLQVSGCSYDDCNADYFTISSSSKMISRIVIDYGSGNRDWSGNTISDPALQYIILGNIKAYTPVVNIATSCVSNPITLTGSIGGGGFPPTTNPASPYPAVVSLPGAPTYAWVGTAGTINSPSAIATTVSGLTNAGGTFTLTAQNNKGCVATQTISVSSVNCAILPVELIMFKAIRTEKNVSIQWQTLTEKNNDYFVVERSIDGISFEEIKRIKGAGNSFELRNYFIIDENPNSEISYYRLKLIGFNGRVTYSDIVSIEADISKASISRIAPNPSSSSIGFDFYAPEKGELLYEITDLTGRVLISESKMVETGNSKIISSLDVLPVGIYFLKVSFEKTNFNTINKIFKN